MALNVFKSGIFPLQPTARTSNPGILARVVEVSDYKVSDPLRPLDIAHVAEVSDRKRLKILSPKRMLQKLPITLAQVKAGNISENLLNEIRKIIHSLYQAK